MEGAYRKEERGNQSAHGSYRADSYGDSETSTFDFESQDRRIRANLLPDLKKPGS